MVFSLSSFTRSTSSGDSSSHQSEVLCPGERVTMVAGNFEQSSRQCIQWKDSMVIIAAAISCLIPVIALIVSAFTQSPGSEIGDDALASEGSPFVRAFTMGWISCLGLKLCHEFIGLVGASSCAALLSC